MDEETFDSFPYNKSRKVSTQAGHNHMGKSVPSAGQMMPLQIQSPGREKSKKSIQSTPSLMEVNITTQTGLIVCIPEISGAGLAELIQSRNI